MRQPTYSKKDIRGAELGEEIATLSAQLQSATYRLLVLLREFDDMEALQAAMNSSEMGAAVEDATNFLDMEKTYAVVVDEKAVIS